MERRRILTVREEVWMRAYVACASSSNVTTNSIPIQWADGALKAFDERFPEQKVAS